MHLEDEVTITGFWAADNKRLCIEFSEGHESVLGDYGYEHLKSNNRHWHSGKDTYVVLAKIGSIPVGGLRFQLKKNNILLPLEKAILPMDEKITEYMANIDKLNPFEICGLWNSKLVGGKKLSYFLSRLGLVLAPSFNWKVSLCFMATYTFRIPRRLGYNLVTDIGAEGYFDYPTKEYQAGVWIHKNIIDLGNCVDSEKERILSLRENRFQSFKEKNTGEGLLIKYNLHV
jgi:hypothetical protein